MENRKVVLITGCSSGIGRELCKIMFDQGYTVIATARNEETLKDVPGALKLSLDVTKKESISAAISEVISRFQKIDILVNNAGYSIRGALEEIDMKSAYSMFDVNVFGIISMIQAVVPEMRRKQSGKIINIGSISGKFVQPINGAYCASKFAVEALSDALRLELHLDNIQVTVIEPGPMRTNFFKTLDYRSRGLSENASSCYSAFYESDAKYRDKQQLADPNEAAKVIAEIISKSRIKSRYKVAVPFAYNIMTHFPDFLKEFIMKRR